MISVILRLVAGEQLADFIPAEESRKPGFTLGMAAGLAEELVSRLSFLPLLYSAAVRKIKHVYAVIFAVVITGLLFAFLHELGEYIVFADVSVNLHIFLVRFIFPGAVQEILSIKFPAMFFTPQRHRFKFYAWTCAM